MTNAATAQNLNDFGPALKYVATDMGRGDFAIFRNVWKNGKIERVFLDIIFADSIEEAAAMALENLGPHGFCPVCTDPHPAEVTGMQACRTCGSLIGTATQDEFDREVFMLWDTTPDDQVTTRAFDVQVDGRRVHGFMNEDNRRITQIG